MTSCLARLTGADRWQHHVLHPKAAPPAPNAALAGGLPAERVHHYYHQDQPFAEGDPGWENAIAGVLEQIAPAVVHTHLLGLTTAVVARQVAKLKLQTRVVAQCYGDELPQLQEDATLAAAVKQACQQCDRIIAFDAQTAATLPELTGANPEQIRVAETGLDTCFRPPAAATDRTAVLYCGELKQAGGLAWLIDAVEQIASEFPGVKLHVTGDGEGRQRDSLLRHMETLPQLIQYHGRLSAAQRASLMQQCHTIVSPVFAAGGIAPLIEAAACGCRVVSTSLPRNVLTPAPELTSAVHLAPPPATGDDNLPLILELPVFRRRLGESLAASLASPLPANPAGLALVLAGRVSQISHFWA